MTRAQQMGLFIAGLFFILASQPVPAAPVRYDYVGTDITNVPDPFPNVTRMTGYFVIDSNEIVSDVNMGYTPLFYSFSDGVTTVEPDNSSVQVFNFRIGSDGSIISWLFNIISDPPYDVLPAHYNMQSSSLLDTTGYCYHPICPSIGRVAGSSTAPGSWGGLVELFLPSITGIWPADANLGDNLSVFIFGSNFTTDGTTEVYFNGVRQFLVAPVGSDMLIVRLLSVTEDLFGCVTVATPYGTAPPPGIEPCVSFGTPLTGLTLTGVWPGTARNGEWESIFLFGTGFTTDGTTAVYFNGVRQWTVAPVSSEMLIVRVLCDASLSGTVTVTTPDDTISHSDALECLP